MLAREILRLAELQRETWIHDPVKLHYSYEGFLENQIGAAFGFVGTAVRVKNRARNEPRG